MDGAVSRGGVPRPCEETNGGGKNEGGELRLQLRSSLLGMFAHWGNPRSCCILAACLPCVYVESQKCRSLLWARRVPQARFVADVTLCLSA